jgi:hypothetical protein
VPLSLRFSIILDCPHGYDLIELPLAGMVAHSARYRKLNSDKIILDNDYPQTLHLEISVRSPDRVRLLTRNRIVCQHISQDIIQTTMASKYERNSC